MSDPLFPSLTSSHMQENNHFLTLPNQEHDYNPITIETDSSFSIKDSTALIDGLHQKNIEQLTRNLRQSSLSNTAFSSRSSIGTQDDWGFEGSIVGDSSGNWGDVDLSGLGSGYGSGSWRR